MLGMKPPRFSLRTLLVLVAIITLPVGWVAYQLDWIRQRHAFLNRPPMPVYSAMYEPAPWSLRLLGERGIHEVSVTDATAEHARELFPEADLWVKDPNAEGGIRTIAPSH